MKKKYTIVGQVMAGHGKGKKLGAPTANLAIGLAEEKKMTPGLYVCTIKLGKDEFRGLLYYGFNSLTLKICLEAYLLGFEGDLYGQTLTITTTEYLREPMIFENEGGLKKQIAKDVARALE